MVLRAPPLLLPAIPSDLKAYLERQRAYHGKSVNALFQVSKGWAKIAARFLIKTLAATNINATFHVRIASRYCALFTHVAFNDADPSALGLLVALLPQLSGLRTLTVTHAAMLTVFTNVGYDIELERWLGVDKHNLLDNALEAFRTVAPQISELSLDNLQANDVIGMLSIFWQVDSLTITGTSIEWSEYGPEIAAALSALTNLKTLALLTVSPSEDDPLDLAFLALAPIPPVSNLTLSTSFLVRGTLTFMRQFAPSLLKLSVSTFPGDRQPPAPRLGNRTFPHLSHLELSGRREHLEPFYTSSSPDSFPCVTDLILDISSRPGWLDPVRYDVLPTAFPHLRSLQLNHEAFLQLDDIGSLTELFKEHKDFTLTTSAHSAFPRGTFFMNEYALRHDIDLGAAVSNHGWDAHRRLYAGKALESIYGELSDAASFLNREVERVNRMKDDVGAIRLAMALRAVQLEETALGL
ncbi:hypothetical protein JCM10213_008824 [Rhodosporidiobolus nylandii]